MHVNILFAYAQSNLASYLALEKSVCYLIVATVSIILLYTFSYLVFTLSRRSLLYVNIPICKMSEMTDLARILSELSDNIGQLNVRFDNVDRKFDDVDRKFDRINERIKEENSPVRNENISMRNQNQSQRQNNEQRGATDANILLGNTNRNQNQGGRRISQIFQTDSPPASTDNFSAAPAQANFQPVITVNQLDHFVAFPSMYKAIDVTIFERMVKEIEAYEINYPHNAAGPARPFSFFDPSTQSFIWSRLNIVKQERGFSPEARALLPEEKQHLLKLNLREFTVLFKYVIKPIDRTELVKALHELIRRSKFPSEKDVAVLQSTTSTPGKYSTCDFWMGMIEVLKHYRKASLMLLEHVEERHIPKLQDKDNNYDHINDLLFDGNSTFKGLESLLKLRWGPGFFGWFKSASYNAPSALSRRDEFPDLCARLLITAQSKYADAVSKLPAQEEMLLISQMTTNKPPATFMRRPSASSIHSVMPHMPDEIDESDNQTDFLVDDGPYWDYSTIYGNDSSALELSPHVNDVLYAVHGRDQSGPHPASGLRSGVKPPGKLFDHRAPNPMTASGKIKKDLACFQLLSQGSCTQSQCAYSHDPRLLFKAAQPIWYNTEYLARMVGEPSPRTAYGEPKQVEASTQSKPVPKTIQSIPKPSSCPPSEFPFHALSRTPASTPRHGSMHALSPGTIPRTPAPLSVQDLDELGEDEFDT